MRNPNIGKITTKRYSKTEGAGVEYSVSPSSVTSDATSYPFFHTTVLTPSPLIVDGSG
jgi:hypothetical protein